MSILRRVVSPSIGIFLVLAAIFTPTASAWIGFQNIPPEELKMTSEPNAPGAPAIILYRQVDRDDNGLTSHEDNYQRIKILTEEGRKQADIEIPFVKSMGNIVGVKARTVRPDGTIANFDGKVFEKTIVKAKGVKFLAKTFTLPDVQVGSIIEYSYTLDLTEHLIYDSRWILSSELFTRRAKFSLKPYTEFAIRWSWHNLPPGTAEPKQGNAADPFIRLETANIPAFPSEDFMPPENELKSRVDFVYSEESFESDPAKYWKKAGKKLNGQLESFVGKQKAMEQVVSQIVSPNDPPEVKLQKIYARVQQLRNTSFEVQKTEQEEKREKVKEAGNVEELWKQGYGTGVQITWLYLALVRAAGLPAEGVWVSDRANYFFSPTLLDSSRLTENVVLVKVNGKDVYCDPGSAFKPFGMLPWSETEVAGLKLDRDGGTWIKTTLPESTESQIERKAQLKLSPETGDLEGKLTVTFSGLEAANLRMEERHEDETDRKKYLEDSIKDDIPVASEVELINKPDWQSSSPTMVAEFKLRIPGWAAAAGRRALVSVGLFSKPEKHVFDHTTRVHPIYFEYPFQKVDDISIELPDGWKVSSLPPPQTTDGHIVYYTIQMENHGNIVHLNRQLKIDFLLVEQKYYLALRTFFQAVKDGDEQQIVLQPGATKASN